MTDKKRRRTILYTCPVCGAGFLTKEDLEEHKKNSHTGEPDRPEDQTTIEDTED